MGKIDMGIFYGKLYNSHNRTFSIINGEKFIDETGHCCHKDLIENLENMIIGNFEYFSLKQGKLLEGIVIWFVKREGIESFKRVSSRLLFSVTCLSTPQDSPFGIFFSKPF